MEQAELAVGEASIAIELASRQWAVGKALIAVIVQVDIRSLQEFFTTESRISSGSVVSRNISRTLYSLNVRRKYRD